MFISEFDFVEMPLFWFSKVKMACHGTVVTHSVVFTYVRDFMPFLVLLPLQLVYSSDL